MHGRGNQLHRFTVGKFLKQTQKYQQQHQISGKISESRATVISKMSSFQQKP